MQIIEVRHESCVDLKGLEIEVIEAMHVIGIIYNSVKFSI